MARRIKFDVGEAAELYRSGQSLDEVAARCGISSGTVRRRLLEAGVEMRRPGGPAGVRGPEPEVETIVALYRAGHSIKAIGAAVGLSDATVWRRLRSAGVETRRPGKPSRAAQPLVDVEWCRQMCEDGHSVEEIAGRLGVVSAVARKISVGNRHVVPLCELSVGFGAGGASGETLEDGAEFGAGKGNGGGAAGAAKAAPVARYASRASATDRPSIPFTLIHTGVIPWKRSTIWSRWSRTR